MIDRPTKRILDFDRSPVVHKVSKLEIQLISSMGRITAKLEDLFDIYERKGVHLGKFKDFSGLISLHGLIGMRCELQLFFHAALPAICRLIAPDWLDFNQPFFSRIRCKRKLRISES